MEKRNYKRGLHRVVRGLLAVALVIGMMPAAAFAATTSSASASVKTGLEPTPFPQAKGKLQDTALSSTYSPMASGGDTYSAATITSQAGAALSPNSSLNVITTYGQVSFHKIVLSQAGKLVISNSIPSSTYYNELGLVMWLPKQNYGYMLYEFLELHSPKGFYLPAGTYYLRLEGVSSTTNTVNLKTAFSAATESFPEPILGNNNSITTANTIGWDKTYYGIIGSSGYTSSADKFDCYKFTLSYPTEISVRNTVTASMKGQSFSLRDANNKILAYGNMGTTLKGSLDAGTYYVVFGNSLPDGCAYTIKLTHGPNSKITGGNYWAKLSWTLLSGGYTGYQVWRSPNGSTGWKLIKTVGATTTSYTDSGLNRYNTYYYKVRGVKGTTVSNFSATWYVYWN